MSWRDIIGTRNREISPTRQNPQNPQNPSADGDSEDFEDFGLKGHVCGFQPSSVSRLSWPSGFVLVVQPSWWPGPPFYVLRTHEEAADLEGDGIAPGMIWTLEEARKLAGLKPEEKLDLARVKAEFNGRVAEVQPLAANAKRRRAA